jgi:hypothetical protein
LVINLILFRYFLRKIYSALSDASKATPRYIRLPRAGQRDEICGLSRSTLSALIRSENGEKPLVKSHSLKMRGAARGIRLIEVESLLAHIAAQGSDTNDENSQAANGS